jgi:hypothetical protein
MTEPIRLYVRLTYEGLPMGNSRSCDAFFREEDAKLRMFGFESTVELAEVRRCVTCTHYDSSRENPGRCTLLSFAVPVRGHCHMHDPLRTIDQAIAALGKGES